MANSPLDLNCHFEQRYAEARAVALVDALSAQRPTILRLASELVFLHQGRRQTATILNSEYHCLKAAAHLPAALALWALQPEPPATRQLQELRNEVASVVADERLSEAARAALLASQSLIDAWLEARTQHGSAAPPEPALAIFRRQAQGAIGRCIDSAARTELRVLHATVSAWTTQFSHEDWRTLKVVICASHQARYRESTKVYFQRLLTLRGGVEQSDSETNEAAGATPERQVIYAENCETEAEALLLLATHHVDRQLASFMFGAAGELQRDVIGDTFVRLTDDLFQLR